MAPRAQKTRGESTYTESGFWGMIRSALRQKSRWWPPIKAAKERARRPHKGANKRQKWEYKCNKCKNWFPDKEVEVDHMVEAGTLRCKEDVGDFIERLFCEKEFLQVLCKPCHLEKTLLSKTLK